jgi:hypothetical protein
MKSLKCFQGSELKWIVNIARLKMHGLAIDTFFYNYFLILRMGVFSNGVLNLMLMGIKGIMSKNKGQKQEPAE